MTDSTLERLDAVKARITSIIDELRGIQGDLKCGSIKIPINSSYGVEMQLEDRIGDIHFAIDKLVDAQDCIDWVWG